MQGDFGILVEARETKFGTMDFWSVSRKFGEGMRRNWDVQDVRLLSRLYLLRFKRGNKINWKPFG